MNFVDIFDLTFKKRAILTKKNVVKNLSSHKILRLLSTDKVASFKSFARDEQSRRNYLFSANLMREVRLNMRLTIWCHLLMHLEIGIAYTTEIREQRNSQ